MTAECNEGQPLANYRYIFAKDTVSRYMWYRVDAVFVVNSIPIYHARSLEGKVLYVLQTAL